MPYASFNKHFAHIRRKDNLQDCQQELFVGEAFLLEGAIQSFIKGCARDIFWCTRTPMILHRDQRDLLIFSSAVRPVANKVSSRVLSHHIAKKSDLSLTDISFVQNGRPKSCKILFSQTNFLTLVVFSVFPSRIKIKMTKISLLFFQEHDNILFFFQLLLLKQPNLVKLKKNTLLFLFSINMNMHCGQNIHQEQIFHQEVKTNFIFKTKNSASNFLSLLTLTATF